MNSPRSAQPALLAPGSAAASLRAYAPGRDARLPAVDERLVAPESNAEIVDGVVYETMGSHPPHAKQHTEVTHVFRGCLAAGYEAAVDMLTRADRKTDAAPDVSVFASAPDPKTGGRRLEEIAFEVLDTESLDHVTKKTRKLAKRGVRRLFYIRVADRTVFEWERAGGAWQLLDAEAQIVDRCFAVPIPVRALADRVVADDTVARALLASGNRVLAEALRQEREGGRLDTLTRQVERRLRRALTAAERELLRARVAALGADRLGDVVMDLAAPQLDAWLRDPDAT